MSGNRRARSQDLPLQAVAAARASSLRRMSRKVTGTAISPVSPLTQSAHWNPPVSATAVACP